MTKSALLIILLSTFNSFGQKSKITQHILFSGKIENPISDTLNLLDKNQDLVQSIILNKNNSFRDTLKLPEGYYRLVNGDEGIKIYLKPNFDLRLTLNTAEFDESIKYQGKGANENNYLAKKALLTESFGQLNYYGYYAKLDESTFLKLTDSLQLVQKNYLQKTKKLDNGFFYLESKALDYEKLEKYANYEKMNQFVTGNSAFKVSENFPNAFVNVDLSDERLLISLEYLSYIRTFLLRTTFAKTTINDQDIDYTLAYVQTIKKEVKNKLIRQELLYKVGKWELNNAKNIDTVYNQIKPYLINKKYLSEVKETYDKLKKTEKGAPSPLFELNDINGKTVSLSDLKGKLVYIDIWATWCLPCIKEIPSLAKMEELFKDRDIQFVSICTEDKEERRKETIKEKNLGGLQLFAPTEETSFFKDYSVRGIPRFILIDKNGKIIDANAKRPSDPALQEEIEKHL
jgi:thiol-disulfide isomerase/thioredoxin